MERILRNKLSIFVFTMPAFLIFTFFVPFPVISSIVYSFTDWDLVGKLNFIGMNNYLFLIGQDAVFHKAVINTFVFVGCSVLFQLPMAFFLAYVLSKKLRGTQFFKNIIFLPVTLSGVAVSLLWYFVYHPEIGLLNNLISFLSGSNFDFAWLSEKNVALYAVIFSVAWQWIGFHMIIFAGGISSIPDAVLESATIDGASEFQTVKRIVLPMIKPILKVSLIQIVISSLRSFDSIYIMTHGGPSHATEVMASHMYFKAFMEMRFGYGCSISTILLFASMFIALVLSHVLRSEEVL